MTQAEAVSETTLRVSRTLAAPRELVFKAWTEPDNLKKWWGVGADYSRGAAISKHLRVLERAGLLTQEKDGRVRRCRLDAVPMKNASDWLARYRRFWEDQLDSLGDYLDQLQRDQSEEEDNPQ